MNEVIGDDILDNEDINIYYKCLHTWRKVEGVQEFRVLNNPEVHAHSPPSKFVSRTFQNFIDWLYIYLVYYLQHEVEATG